MEFKTEEEKREFISDWNSMMNEYERLGLFQYSPPKKEITEDNLQELKEIGVIDETVYKTLKSYFEL